MRFHETLEDILGSKIKIRILRLFYRTRGSYTGRETAKLVEFSQDATQRALNDLTLHGLLKRDYVGTSYNYYLNEDHMLVDKVVNKAFFAEQNSIREIARIFKEQLGEEFQRAVVFGSVAKNKERPDSDVDILVVVRDGVVADAIEDKVNEAANLATAASGNPVTPIVIQAGEYGKKKKAKSKQGIWKDIFDRDKSIIYTREDIETYGAEDQ
ncbi:MAG: nucleotidyltransferase domain-containing protein [Candidatus Thermoplasmatota archaeon]|nr:nucleotidyltransferase domain-containing protein [Actinomycetota bacterium]MDD5778684.1 nucleotidyltransferase domain-containing protein [Candidatus Thermoplasmatota archaeon]